MGRARERRVLSVGGRSKSTCAELVPAWRVRWCEKNHRIRHLYCAPGAGSDAVTRITRRLWGSVSDHIPGMLPCRKDLHETNVPPLVGYFVKRLGAGVLLKPGLKRRRAPLRKVEQGSVEPGSAAGIVDCA